MNHETSLGGGPRRNLLNTREIEMNFPISKFHSWTIISNPTVPIFLFLNSSISDRSSMLFAISMSKIPVFVCLLTTQISNGKYWLNILKKLWDFPYEYLNIRVFSHRIRYCEGSIWIPHVHDNNLAMFHHMRTVYRFAFTQLIDIKERKSRSICDNFFLIWVRGNPRDISSVNERARNGIFSIYWPQLILIVNFKLSNIKTIPIQRKNH